MPELPEVETTLRGIGPHLLGQRVRRVLVRQWQLRWPIPPGLPEQLRGQTVLNARRRGKYLMLEFPRGNVILHLGMSGSLRLVPSDAAAGKHDHVDFELASGMSLRLTDPRKFGAVLWSVDADNHPLITHLGPEPLSDAFTGDYLFRRSRKRKTAIKTFIMDARIVVGVGNIYANEALFLAGIRPGKAAGRLSRQQCETLAAQAKHVLQKSITAGGTTLRDFVGGDGKPGYFKQQLFVYGRGGEACQRCREPLKERRLGQRSTVYCSHCQR